MDSSKPAFPVPSYVNADGETHDSSFKGMTLRDYFAGQALVAFQIGDEFAAWRRNQYEGGMGGSIYAPTMEPRKIAEACYLIADAMVLASKS